MKAKEAVFSRGDAETQREVLDRINRIDRIKSVGERILEHVHFSSLPLGFEILP